MKTTIGSNEASPAAKALVLALRDVLSNEEAWAIAQEHLDRYLSEMVEVDETIPVEVIPAQQEFALLDDPQFERETIEGTRAVVARVLAARRE